MIFGKKVHIKYKKIKVATFWSIPISTPTEVDVKDEWFPDITPKQALDFTAKSCETLVGAGFKGLFNGARSGNRTIQGRE